MASPKNPGSVGKDEVYKTRGPKTTDGGLPGKPKNYELPDFSMGNDGSKGTKSAPKSGKKTPGEC